MASIDAEVVKHALQVARDHGFAEVELANGEAQFRASLEPAARKKPQVSGVIDEPDAPPETTFLSIKATHVGYFREDEGKLVIGNHIAKGDVVASISTLGLANDVESTVAGEIVEVLVKDGDAVEFGQAIARVKP
ncbi:MAG: biotin/lipoyl-binding protein [Chlorobia bacterium]|nr:biotin/lipoyl-binding protein [Fimbriimonadaceae bacterium]